MTKEDITAWRRSPEKITLEEFAARLGKIVGDKKEEIDMSTILNDVDVQEQKILEAVAGLSDIEKAIIHLLAGGWGYHEIAQYLGCSNGITRSKANYIFRKLKQVCDMDEGLSVTQNLVKIAKEYLSRTGFVAGEVEKPGVKEDVNVACPAVVEVVGQVKPDVFELLRDKYFGRMDTLACHIGKCVIKEKPMSLYETQLSEARELVSKLNLLEELEKEAEAY